MMNILIVACSSHLYGANQSLLNMLSSCDRDRYNYVVVLPNDGPLVNKIRSMGFFCEIIAYRFNCASQNSVLGYYMRFLYYNVLNFFALKKLVRFARTHKIDIIHTNNVRIHIGYDTARCLGIKHVWHLREFMDLDFEMKPFKSFDRITKDINRSDAVICVSEAVKRHFHVQNKKTWIIYNAVESIYKLRDIVIEKERYFLFCGSLSENKGIFDAIFSFSKILKEKNLKLYIAGTGSAHVVKKIKAIIQKENLQGRVVLLGFRADSKELMRKSIALLMCSKHEAFGRVTAEAMISDCLVIGRNSGGTSELIEHGVTGFLFNTNEELVECMEKALEIDTIDIRNKAKEKAIHSFTEEVYAEQLRNVYNSLNQ